MRKVSVILLFSLILSGCSEKNQITDDDSLEEQEGIIAHKREIDDNNNQLLLIPDSKNEELDDKTLNQLTGEALEKNGAYYYVASDNFEELEVGSHVIVHWNGTQEDSEIPQREAEKITIVTE